MQERKYGTSYDKSLINLINFREQEEPIIDKEKPTVKLTLVADI